MSHQVTYFTDANHAWPQWNQSDVDFKRQYLLSLERFLFGRYPDLAKAMRYQLKHSLAWVNKVENMPGPTGETNELYSSGRGVCVIAMSKDTDTPSALQAIFAIVTSSLLAGNTIIFCSDNEVFNTIMTEALNELNNLTPNVVQLTPYDALQPLLAMDIRGFAYVGTADVEQTLNLTLAQRDGAIISMVSETDFVALPTAQDPNLVLRFITERTRTINITAVGGNATLLELGNEAH
ncbi:MULTISPECIES: 1-pyrroline-5-carboxylate dehydrogenase [unclassified Vibrio]|uniref:1-pyrroline-5-carboxylate dehydrogenase n=1 Tax=Vibrio sp. HB236076 TaxID=3232307 RepID=A0AB39HK46_9VIBR|nr:1-pyrroline-5-carboxylate dehydrogenase [Vibrio sp. HB161653]MDP5252593.1 1-pyrroline-5-carboxylate dehydrogenase [Vibrio sp. HB161653]